MKFHTTLISLCTVISLTSLSSVFADTDIYAPFPAPTDSCPMPTSQATSADYCGTAGYNGCYINTYAVPGCEAIKDLDPLITNCDPQFIAANNCVFTTQYQCDIEQSDCEKIDPNVYPDLDCGVVHQSCIEQLNTFKQFCC